MPKQHVAGQCLKFASALAASITMAYCGATLAADAPGFLTAKTAPSSLAILPPPPAENSVAFLADKAAYESGHVLRNAVRTRQAALDANYENFDAAFSPVFGSPINAKQSPKLYHLIQRVLTDSHDHAMRAAKNHYMRVRPFVVYKDPTCTPEKDAKMSKTGSYPSGHASFGWAAALVLAEINPLHQTELLRRGYEFGQSRVVCGAHWQSDVDAGRLMGAAVVARLHADPQFQQALNEARQEFARHHH